MFYVTTQIDTNRQKSAVSGQFFTTPFNLLIWRKIVKLHFCGRSGHVGSPICSTWDFLLKRVWPHLSIDEDFYKTSFRWVKVFSMSPLDSFFNLKLTRDDFKICFFFPCQRSNNTLHLSCFPIKTTFNNIQLYRTSQ